MAIETRDDNQLTGESQKIEGKEQVEKKTMRYNNHHNQLDNKDNIFSMFSGDSSNIVAKSI